MNRRSLAYEAGEDDRTPLLRTVTCCVAYFTWIDKLLTQISDHVGESPEALAVTVASRISPFATLVSTVLSLRTRDEVTAIVTPRTIERASTPQMMASLSEKEIQELIYPTSFYRMKAGYLKEMSQQIIDQFNGQVPDTMEGLLSLKGIGRKSANLVLTLGFGKPGICVDTHVLRVGRRLSLHKGNNAKDAEMQLRSRLPSKWWIPINGVLIAFGRTQCTPVLPKCSSCPVSKWCHRIGVSKSR